MNKLIKNYLNSLRFNKKYWYTFIIDVFTFWFITLLFIGLGKILEVKADAISQGKTAEQLKAALVSGSLEANKLFVSDVKTFTFYLIFGIVLALIISLLIYSLSRILVWDKILKHKFSWKKFRGWNGLSIILTIIILFYMIFFYAVNMFLPVASTFLQSFLLSVINSSLILFFMYFFFLSNYSFATTGKIWSSIGNAFHLIKFNWKRLWKMFVLVIFTWLLIKMAIYYVHVWFQIVPQQLLSSVINISITLLFFAWLRLYLLRTIHRTN